MIAERTIERNKRWFFSLKSLRDGSNVLLNYEDNVMTVETANLQLAADIVLSITDYLNLDQLQVRFFWYYFNKFNIWYRPVVSVYKILKLIKL